MEKLKQYQKTALINICNNLKIECTNANILKNLNKIYDFINNKSQYVITTKRDYLIILNIFLKNINQKKTADIVYKKAKEYNDLYLQRELKQGLSETEEKNYIKYDVLFNKVNDLINIYNDTPNKKNIINLLILALYVLHAPNRNIYNDLIIINDESEETDKTKNYFLKTNNNNYYVIINKDKVSNKHGRGEIPITDTTLRTILNIYFSLYATNNIYLFEDENHKPYTKRKIQYIINQYFKEKGKILNIHNLRSAYISEYYKHNPQLEPRVILADFMRHTESTANLVYCKYF